MDNVYGINTMKLKITIDPLKQEKTNLIVKKIEKESIKVFGENIVEVSFSPYEEFHGFKVARKMEVDVFLPLNISDDITIVGVTDGEKYTAFTDDTVSEELKSSHYCEQCKSERFRILTYIVKKGERLLKVGSSCVDAYTGTVGLAKNLVTFNKLFSELRECDEKIKPLFYDTEYIISLAIKAIKEYGYYPLTNNEGMEPTFETMLLMLGEDVEEFSDEMYAIKELMSSNKLSKSNYHTRVKDVFDSWSVSYKDFALIAYGVEKYPSLLGRSKSKWFGNIGGMYEFDLTVISNIAYGTKFGKRYTHKLIDKHGNLYEWKTNKKLKLNDKVVSGTVRDHIISDDTEITQVYYCVTQ